MKIINRDVLADKVKSLRARAGISQQEIANKLSIPRPSVSQIETGRRDLTALELLSLSKIFNVSVNSFFDG